MVELTENEPDDARQAHDQEWPGHQGGDRIVLDVGESEHEATEAEDRQGHREEVRLDAGIVLAEVA